MTIAFWFTPAMVALVIWGITAFLPKLVLRSLSPDNMIVYASTFFFVGAMAMQVLYGGPEMQFPGVWFAMATGACGTIGQILYLQALKKGPLTYVSMISSLYPLVATTLAVTLLKDHITLRQTAGVALGVAAIILLVKADRSHDRG
jgi:drug/metabolite transporter (DMT)-like permease